MNGGDIRRSADKPLFALHSGVAKALGNTLPPTMLAHADKVIEYGMSAFGTERTSWSRSPMSAFGGKADISRARGNVCF
jgi:hypothetical protein